jgi:hypothetical protein
MSLIKLRNDVIATQLPLYNDNKSSFVAAIGKEAYNNKMIELLGKLPDPSAPMIGHEEGHDEDDEESGSNS